MMKVVKGVAGWLLPVFSLMVWLTLGIFFLMESETVYRNSQMDFSEVKNISEDGIITLEDGEEVSPNEGYIYVTKDSKVQYSKEQNYLVVPLIDSEIFYRYFVFSVASFSVLIFVEIWGSRRRLIKSFWYVSYFLGGTVVYTSMDRGYLGKDFTYLWYWISFFVGTILFKIIRLVRSRKE